MNAKNIKETLLKARETYGHKNQILVCIEELNELACVLAKYPRYDDEGEALKSLSGLALDEVADVMIILDHVQNIFKLSDEEIAGRIEQKVERVNRWLESSSSMQKTVEDREVGSRTCESCEHKENEPTLCNTCRKSEAVDGSLPFFKDRFLKTT